MAVLKNTLRESRAEYHVKQQELADVVGVTRETIGRLERGELQNPNFRLVYYVAKYFGKPVDDLFKYLEDDEEEGTNP